MPDPAAVNSMFARIAKRYDLANRLLCAGTDVSWRNELVRAVRKTDSSDVLDLATGSGDVAFALSRKLPASAHITGVDFCEPMLRQAESKKRAAAAGRYANIEFRQGDALALPFDDSSFDALTIAFGLRNLADRPRGLREMRRVLRHGGHLFVLEFSQPHPWFRPLYCFYLRRMLPAIAEVITGDRAAYEYLNETIGRFPDRPALTAEISAAGFSDVSARPMTLGIVALHTGQRA